MKRTWQGALFVFAAAVGAACAGGPTGTTHEATRRNAVPKTGDWVAAADPCWCGAAVGGLASTCTTQAERGGCVAHSECTWICE